MRFLEEHHVVSALRPDADALAGTATGDVINLEAWGHVAFIIHKGVGTTGTSTVTVEACDNTTPDNTSAIAFRYRQASSGDSWDSSYTTATASGFTTSASSNEMYCIDIDRDDLLDGNGYSYVRIKLVESANDPVDAGVLAVLSEPRYASGSNATAIT